MRIMIKGGVWKNTEDEILKAAVMKYGLNQWARISSLLTRKSAKQCKARWYEWLDPAIKKTEWTKEEDEKLLHLAKLFPTQWRTIAPIVGRTPAQCLERYEKLLDMALAKDDKYDPADDPRRLRPGEIDPNPEAKPARPDPVDMDEDEKEMLSEARARLANTRGKKAKRKARESQLEEARRLASLQKKRELKAAGIELRGKERRKRGINYNKEVAFERNVPAGFYDITAERERTKEVSQEFRPVTLQELEGKRRKDIEEALIKKDIKKHKLQESHNQPAAIDKVAKLNDPVMIRGRGKLMLPAPQISEQELQQIAKMGGELGVDPDLADGAGGEATRKLLGQYDQTPSGLATPLRTPRTPAIGGDRIMQEAHNLAKLRNAETPLLGQENPDLYPSDFSGITPRNTSVVTPNPLATPHGGGATPRAGQIAGVVPPTPSVAGTPLTTSVGSAGVAGSMATPIRDELGLNDPSMVASVNKKEEAARQMLMRNQLKAQLNQLPTAKNKVEVVVPEEAMEEDEPVEPQMEEDAADVELRKKQLAEKAKEIELKKRSQVLQRGLPRPPTVVQPHALKPGSETEGLGMKEQAEQLISIEMAAIMQADAIQYPIGKREKKKKKDKKRDRSKMANGGDDLENFELEDLESASKILKQEAEFVKKAMGHTRVTDEEYSQAWLMAEKELCWIPSELKYGRAQSASTTDKINSIKQDFQGIRGEMEKEARKAQRLEEKIRILCLGHWTRDEKLQSQTNAIWAELQQFQMDKESYLELQRHEKLSAPIRLQALKDMVAVQRDRETALQDRYKELGQKLADLREADHQTMDVVENGQ